MKTDVVDALLFCLDPQLKEVPCPPAWACTVKPSSLTHTGQAAPVRRQLESLSYTNAQALREACRLL
jgi:hypothetical protein